MLEVVLDKSYLDGAAAAAIADLCDRYSVLMPQELFFELMTTNADSQRHCFSKLTNRDSPVALIPPVGFLFRQELQSHRGSAPLAQHRVDKHRYAFNQRLRDNTFVPRTEDLEQLTAWQSQVQAETRRFVERCFEVRAFFPELDAIDRAGIPGAVAAARQKVAVSVDVVRGIYASFLNEAAPADAPRAEQLDPSWALFRWVQCQLLAALRIFGRYQGAIPRDAGQPFWTRAEHSMLDTYYLILGSLADGLATLDSEIREDFLLLRPDSVTCASGVFARAKG